MDIGVAYRAHQYLSVDGAINGRVLNDAQKQGLGGCFDVSGNRADFSVLLLLLREELEAARQEAELRKQHEQQLLQQLKQVQQQDTLAEQQQQQQLLLLQHQKLLLQQQQEELEQQRQQLQGDLRRQEARDQLLFGPVDAVWKHDRALLAALEPTTVTLDERPSVHVAALDIHDNLDVVQRMVVEAGGVTEKEGNNNPLSPFGHRIAAAAAVYCEQKDAAFNGALHRNEARLKGHMAGGSQHPFAPKYDTGDGERVAVLERVTLPAGQRYGLLNASEVGMADADPRVRIQRVFHGVPSLAVAHAILCGDFAALQKNDEGFFGTGFYFSPDLDHVLMYATPCGADTAPAAFGGLKLKGGKRYKVVLACDVQYGNPYPVLKKSEFKGQPFAAGHDAHVAVVKYPQEDLADAQPFGSSAEWAAAEARMTTRPLAEIAINDPSCVTVRAVLIFEA